jgi:hypothetical protein
MSDEPSLVDHFRRALLAYQTRAKLDVATLAREMEASVPGMLAVPHRALQSFLEGEGEPSDAFISICSRFLARQNRGG